MFRFVLLVSMLVDVRFPGFKRSFKLQKFTWFLTQIKPVLSFEVLTPLDSARPRSPQIELANQRVHCKNFLVTEFFWPVVGKTD